jgi:hypothetical protein
MTESVIYQCQECSLHYRDESTAMACEEFCRANQACNMDIAKHAIENEAQS